METLIRNYEAHCRALEQSSFINQNQSSAEKFQFRQKLELNYINWFEYFFPHYAKVPSAWFHKKMAKIIIQNDHCNLLAEIYRSGAKSVHLCMGIPLYLYVTKKLHFMVLVGQTEPKAKKLISDIQSQLTHNKRFIHYYGSKYKYGDWSEGDFTTTDGVKFVCLGIGQSPRGLREQSSRPDYIVVDDVDTKERCNNDQRSQKAVEWVWEDLKGTFDEGGNFQRLIVANNNFHKNCVINILKKDFNLANENANRREAPKKHFIITVPAVKDLSTFTSNWPEKTSALYWKQKFEDTPYRSFMREYMHIPIIEGSIFKNEHIIFTKILPLHKYTHIVAYCDPSFKSSATSDYKAIAIVGLVNNQIHILDCFVRQCSVSDMVNFFFSFHGSLPSNVIIEYWMEANFAQDLLLQEFETQEKTHNIIFPLRKDNRKKPDKFGRIENLSTLFERNLIFFNNKKENLPDTRTAIDQLLSFEKGSRSHDDFPDALEGAIFILQKYIKTSSSHKNYFIQKRINNFKY